MYLYSIDDVSRRFCYFLFKFVTDNKEILWGPIRYFTLDGNRHALIQNL